MHLAQTHRYIDATVPAGTHIRRAAVGDLDAHGRALWGQRQRYQKKALEKGWALRPAAWLCWVGGKVRFVTLEEMAPDTQADRDFIEWHSGAADAAA